MLQECNTPTTNQQVVFTYWQHLRLYQDGIHSWWIYCAAPLRETTVGTIAQFPTQTHYPDTDQTKPCRILIRMSNTLGSDKYRFSSWFDLVGIQTADIPQGKHAALLLQPLHHVWVLHPS